MTLDEYWALEQDADSQAARAVQGVLRLLRIAADTGQARSFIEDTLAAVSGCMGKIGDSNYRFKEYDFQFGIVGKLRRAAESLQRVAQLEVYAAPRLVEFIAIGDGSGVLVTWIPGLGEQQLIPCSCRREAFAPLAIERVRADFQALTSARLVHEFAAAGCAHWFEHPVTRHIIFNAWDTLRPIGDEEDEQRVSTAIEKLLAEVS